MDKLERIAKQILQDQQQQFHRTLATKLLGYALGRGELLADQPLIDDMVSSIATGEDHFSDFVIKIVTSPQFRYHRGRGEQHDER